MKSLEFDDLAVFAPADKPDGNLQLPKFDDAEMKRRAQLSRDVASGLGQIIVLMLHGRQHRHTMLSELEWLIMPAVTFRQFRLAEGVNSEKGFVAPIAAVLWANVSAEVDKRISENINQQIKLKPEEWRSGEHTWIVEALGDPKAVSALLQHLKQNELKDKTVRMRVRGQDGKMTAGRLELQADTPST